MTSAERMSRPIHGCGDCGSMGCAGMGYFGAGSGAGFAAATFFDERPVNGPAPLETVRIPPLLRASLDHAPLDLAESGRTWLYSVTGLDAPGAPPSLLFSVYPVEQELTILPVRITQVEAPDEDWYRIDLPAHHHLARLLSAFCLLDKASMARELVPAVIGALGDEAPPHEADDRTPALRDHARSNLLGRTEVVP